MWFAFGVIFGLTAGAVLTVLALIIADLRERDRRGGWWF